MIDYDIHSLIVLNGVIKQFDKNICSIETSVRNEIILAMRYSKKNQLFMTKCLNDSALNKMKLIQVLL